MIIKTRAIVLRNTAYGDDAVISKMYTREYGIRSYIINGVRKPKARISMAHLQTLNLLDLEAYEKPNSGIQRIKELKNRPLLFETARDFRKRGVAMFLVELLNGCLHAEDCEYELFDFLESWIVKLEETERVSDFPIRFMIAMSQMLGIEPQADYSSTQPYLNLETGMHEQMKSGNCAEADVSYGIQELRQSGEDIGRLSADLRKKMLNTLILYYQIHLMPNKAMMSVDILSEVMDSWHKV